MIIALKLIHVLICLFLIIVVLLQTGKGQDIGAAFGGSSQTVFGPSGGGSFFGKLTAVMAMTFMVTSIMLGYFAGKKRVETVIPETQAPITSPAQPEAIPPLPVAPEKVEVPDPVGLPQESGGAVSEVVPQSKESVPPLTAPSQENKSATP